MIGELKMTALSLLYKLSFKTKKEASFIGVLPVSLFLCVCVCVCICGFFNVYILENANVLKPKLSTEMSLYFFPMKTSKETNSLQNSQQTSMYGTLLKEAQVQAPAANLVELKFKLFYRKVK